MHFAKKCRKVFPKGFHILIKSAPVLCYARPEGVMKNDRGDL